MRDEVVAVAAVVVNVVVAVANFAAVANAVVVEPSKFEVEMNEVEVRD